MLYSDIGVYAKLISQTMQIYTQTDKTSRGKKAFKGELLASNCPDAVDDAVPSFIFDGNWYCYRFF